MHAARSARRPQEIFAIRSLTTAALLLLAHAASAGPAELRGFEKQECRTFGEAYFRLAGLRDSGAGKALAVQNVAEWMENLGQTGSHVRGKDQRGAVRNFADYVYARRQYGPSLLYVHGLYQCSLARSAASDELFAAGMQQLEDATARCKQTFDEQERRKELGTCIEQAMQAPPPGGGAQ